MKENERTIDLWTAAALRLRLKIFQGKSREVVDFFLSICAYLLPLICCQFVVGQNLKACSYEVLSTNYLMKEEALFFRKTVLTVEPVHHHEATPVVRC